MPLTRIPDVFIKRFVLLILVVLVLIPLLMVGTGRAARLAGEEDPVPTAAGQSLQKAASAAPAGAVQPAAPPAAGKPAAAATAAGAVQPVRPAAAPAPAGQVAPAASPESAGGLPRRPPASPAAAVPVPTPVAPQPQAVRAAAAQPSPLSSAPAAQGQTAAPAPPPVAAAAPPPPPSQPARPAVPQAGPTQSGRYVTIDFDNVDISVFIKFVSELTGRNFVIDERVKGKVTVISPKKIAVEEVYKVFESVLEIYGFATVEAGEVIKVIPALDARGKELELRLNREEIKSEDKIVTQILSLKYASPDEMKKVLDPLISKNSIILAYAPTGMLIITDVLSNVKRLQEIVAALDVEGVGEVLSYIPLQSASATEIVRSLTAVFPPQRAGSPPIRIVADDRTNSVIVLATETYTAHVKQLILLMDKEIPRGGNVLHVYRLQNATAEELVKVLSNLPKDTRPPTAPAIPAAATAAAAAAAATRGAGVLSRDVSVVADKATNTLIITADRADFKILEGIIQKLDEPRPMVYIEALIMEVSVSKNFNVGVEWRGIKDTGSMSDFDTGRSAAFIGSGGAGASGGYNIIPGIPTTGNPIAFPGGFSMGILGAGISVGGVIFPNIGAVLQAYQKDSDVSILSTPQLLTLNNEDAEINVGKNVPYITRSDTSSVSGSGSTQSAVYGQSYEYKDVGINLKITPNINEDQFVRLKIDQQVTKLADVSQTTTPTTLKRTAKTTVMVKDNETVVIGGMIDDSSSVATAQVPCLGDIPLLGWLFKTMGQGREKTNLFIFITPHIVRNQAEAAEIYKKKLEDIGNVEEGVIRMNEKKPLPKPQADRKE